MMNDAEFNELCGDMAKHGYRPENPIITYQGKILDGRNRFNATEKVGVLPMFVEFCGDDPLAFVLSQNLHRRHLNESQRAMIAAQMAKLENGQAGNGRSSANLQSYSQAEAAKKLSVSPRLVANAKRVYEIAPTEIIKEITDGKLTVSQYIHNINRKEKLETISQNNQPLNGRDKKYSVILADPPWEYEHPISDSRRIENHYPTMPIEEICALPVQDICSDDAVVFLWVTTPMLKKGLQVLEAWGFEYRTERVWIKPSIGPGYWVRNRHEHLLIGVRGELPTPEYKPDSVIEAPREEHSKKPDSVYDDIEKMYPGLDRVELFARQRRDGWDSWGNQA
jgi:N6-adenosine-specific RNA methylase IME4